MARREEGGRGARRERSEGGREKERKEEGVGRRELKGGIKENNGEGGELGEEEWMHEGAGGRQGKSVYSMVNILS